MAPGGFKNYYQQLELADGATLEAVKAAFRKLARQYHPDLNPGNRQAEERFKALNEAYEVLGDPDRKAAYDVALQGQQSVRSGNRTPPTASSKASAPEVKKQAPEKRPTEAAPQKPSSKASAVPPPGPSGATGKAGPKGSAASVKGSLPKVPGFQELFETLFKQGLPSSAESKRSSSNDRQKSTGHPHTQPTSQPTSQPPSQSPTAHPPSEPSAKAATSSTTSVPNGTAQGPQEAPNPLDSQSAHPPGSPTAKTVRAPNPTGANGVRGQDVAVETTITPSEAKAGVVKLVNVQHTDYCPRCAGTGKLNGQICGQCNGQKTVSKLKKIEVRIPPGVREGSKVRVAGEGGRGIAGGDPGDLFLLIRLAVDAALRIEGLDVHRELAITITQAVLGAVVSVPTLHGTIDMTIPPLTPSGKVFRLRGQGVQSGSAQGDQLVTVMIQPPSRLTPEEKALYQQLARLAGEKPPA
ncbi:MAG: DnaJ C-terminal domain-containing protein [Candidatus Melainabacteria bacterium]|nr:DnaJ C-terminal domain-containing protein [Candidatus Melainabacteria bacterium]